MSVFTKVLRAGEGKKVRRLAELVPLIGALEPDMQGLSDDALAHKTVEFKERLDRARASTTSLWSPTPWSARRPGACSASVTSTSS